MTYPLPKMIVLTVPLGDDPDDTLTTSLPLYGDLSVEALEVAVRETAERAVRAMRERP